MRTVRPQRDELPLLYGVESVREWVKNVDIDDGLTGVITSAGAAVFLLTQTRPHCRRVQAWCRVHLQGIAGGGKNLTTISRAGPWKTIQELELATLGWVRSYSRTTTAATWHMSCRQTSKRRSMPKAVRQKKWRKTQLQAVYKTKCSRSVG